MTLPSEPERHPTPSDVVIIIPARNEAGHIALLLRHLRQRGFRRVVVVDDGSSDRTGMVARRWGAELVALTPSRGKGYAIRSGMAYVLSAVIPSAVILMDGDGQHAPADLPRFLQEFKVSSPDLIIGVRAFRMMSPLRRRWNRWISTIISVLIGQRLHDSQSGFRLLSRRAAQALVLRENGYAVESEMIFWAARNGIRIAEVSIQTRPSVRPANLVSDLWRAVAITAFVLQKGAWHCLERMAAGSLRRGRGWRVFSSAILAGLLAATMAQALGQARGPATTERSSFGLELKTALEWLREHSEPDATVMAHWFYGHQIVAFADRRVVSTTKVYPTESSEVAERHRDIAKFFLTENEDEAVAIAARYGARYVFATKRFEGWICRPLNACHLSPDLKRLAPWARETMASRMAEGDTTFARFTKIWDSNRITLYRVGGAGEEFSPRERAAALAIARRVLTATLRGEEPMAPPQAAKLLRQYRADERIFSQRRTVDVTIWNRQELRSSRTISAGTVLENLIQSAVAAANDPRFLPVHPSELPELRIEVVVLRTDRSPLDDYLIRTAPIDPSRTYLLGRNGITVYFAPETFNVVRFIDHANLLAVLCDKAGSGPMCSQEPGATAWMSGADDFMESRDHQRILTLSGPLVADGTFSPSALRERLMLAAEWTIGIQDPAGSFPARQDPLSADFTRSPEWQRQALAVQSLTRAYRLTQDERYLRAAERARRYLEESEAFALGGDRELMIATLSFELLADLELHRATQEERHVDRAQARAERIWALQDFSDNATLPGRSSAYSLTALATFARERNDHRRDGDLATLADRYREQFRTDRILRPQKLSLARSAWLVNGFAELYRLTREEGYADFALEVADWLADLQIRGEPALTGSFPNTLADQAPYTRGTGKIIEALVDAGTLADALGNPSRGRRYDQVAKQALDWLMRMQLTAENTYWVNRLAIDQAIGAFRHDLLNQELWIDSASHFILAASDYLRPR